MSKSEHQTHQFAPVYDAEARVLILGTFPSVKSRETEFYYGNPQNRFWKIIAELTNTSVPESIEEKKTVLLAHHIAIWDVIASCDIVGSSDSSIQNVVPSDIKQVLKKTAITHIYANGNTAKKLYEKYVKEQTKKEIIGLPSTSPANAAYSLERLLMHWGQIKEVLEGEG